MGNYGMHNSNGATRFLAMLGEELKHRLRYADTETVRLVASVIRQGTTIIGILEPQEAELAHEFGVDNLSDISDDLADEYQQYLESVGMDY